MLIFPTINEMLKYSIHIGHSFKNTLLFASWMIKAFRQKIALINLYKFIYMLKIGFHFLKNLTLTNKPIWFINLEKNVWRYIKAAANNCGEFFVSSQWVHGMLSNYFSVFNSYKKHLNLNVQIKNKRNTRESVVFDNWIFTRFSWPRLLFISSVFHSPIAVKESSSLNLPVIGIVDTNVKSQSINIALPGNDDSLQSIIFYNDLISSFILFYKFKSIFLWFSNVRKNSRLTNFGEWLVKRKLKVLKKSIFTNFSYNSISLNSILNSGFSFLFAVSTNAKQQNIDFVSIHRDCVSFKYKKAINIYKKNPRYFFLANTYMAHGLFMFVKGTKLRKSHKGYRRPYVRRILISKRYILAKTFKRNPLYHLENQNYLNRKFNVLYLKTETAKAIVLNRWNFIFFEKYMKLKDLMPKILYGLKTESTEYLLDWTNHFLFSYFFLSKKPGAEKISYKFFFSKISEKKIYDNFDSNCVSKKETFDTQLPKNISTLYMLNKSERKKNKTYYKLWKN